MNIEVFTPDDISEKVCERVFEPFLLKNKKIEDLTICDPCVGKGDLLVYFVKKYNIPIKNVYAYDIKEEYVEYTVNRLKREFNEICYNNFKVCDFLYDDSFFVSNTRFNVIIMNPPYLGGGKISSFLGSSYLKMLKSKWPGKVGDIAAYFIRKAWELLESDRGVLSCVATNTIAQGTTRLIGLKYLVGDGAQIYNAYTNVQWPTERAAVTVHIFTCTNMNRVMEK